MTIEFGLATVETIEKELTSLFKGNYKWGIKKMNTENEFLITFPSEDIRSQLARFKGFDFQTSIVKANVVPTELSTGADGNLDVVWVKAFNFPPKAKTLETVMEVAYLVGDPEEVDTSTLSKPGPVRIKLACRDYGEIKGEAQVFFNGESHRIKWVVELPERKISKDASNSKFERRRGKDGEGDEDEEEGDSYGSRDYDVDKQKESGKQAPPVFGEGQGGSNKKQKTCEETKPVEVEQEVPENNTDESFNTQDLQMEGTEGEGDPAGTQTSVTKETDVHMQEGVTTDLEEEMIDYEDDPLSQEKIEMAHLDKVFEEKTETMRNLIKLPVDTGDKMNKTNPQYDIREVEKEPERKLSNVQDLGEKEFITVKAGKYHQW
ncbi:hypothetical protein C2845_PM01G32990 [Panicum miliaceum]|uniref:DUF4283 domain-containing protein n=1 Tax=Panicum miliaceum TaxID=4540 RepID=A0A3L6TJD9_PANMI|nr:hypothetical protein C2845_PM01G32990 [Panicum miliaceum]